MASSQPTLNRLVEIDREECMLRLGHSGVGRVAVTVNALPAIFPVNYALLDGDIVFRTGPGTKLDAALAGAVVAFEIDHTDSMSHTGWSVLVVGEARPVTDPNTVTRAAALPLTPWADGRRDTFIRLTTQLVTGRELVYGPGTDGS
jgi:nitroimidazol reductase NimA-like FMN-containing flavoprotein (pyridoxamine 5'-phosphate oxidase superfamily)